MSIFLVTLKEELLRLQRTVESLFRPPLPGIPLLQDGRIQFIGYEGMGGYSAERLMECDCDIPHVDYPRRLRQLALLVPVREHFSFYSKAVAALLLARVQLGRFAPESDLYELTRSVTEAMPGQHIPERNAWNDTLLLTSVPTWAMFQDMWDDGWCELLLAHTNLMLGGEVLNRVCLRASQADLLWLCGRLEMLEARVRHRMPQGDMDESSLVPNVFLCLMRCSLSAPNSIHALLPYVERLQSPYLQMDVLYLLTTHFDLYNYRHIVGQINRYQREFLVWNQDYFELLLHPDGLNIVHRLENLTSEQAILLVRALKGRDCTWRLRAFVRRHARTIREIHADVHTDVLATPWLLEEYLSFHETNRDWVSKYWLGDKCCVIDAMRHRYDLVIAKRPYRPQESYAAFREMAQAIDLCYAEEDGSGGSLDFMLCRSLIERKSYPGGAIRGLDVSPPRNTLHRIAAHHHVQYFHFRSPYAISAPGNSDDPEDCELKVHPAAAAKEAVVFAALLPRRIPEAVIRYILEWI